MHCQVRKIKNKKTILSRTPRFTFEQQCISMHIHIRIIHPSSREVPSRDFLPGLPILYYTSILFNIFKYFITYNSSGSLRLRAVRVLYCMYPIVYNTYVRTYVPRLDVYLPLRNRSKKSFPFSFSTKLSIRNSQCTTS